MSKNQLTNIEQKVIQKKRNKMNQKENIQGQSRRTFIGRSVAALAAATFLPCSMWDRSTRLPAGSTILRLINQKRNDDMTVSRIVRLFCFIGKESQVTAINEKTVQTSYGRPSLRTELLSAELSHWVVIAFTYLKIFNISYFWLIYICKSFFLFTPERCASYTLIISSREGSASLMTYIHYIWMEALQLFL